MTIEDCREEVKKFAVAMEQRLRENDDKPGWKEDPHYLLSEKIRDHWERFENLDIPEERKAIRERDNGICLVCMGQATRGTDRARMAERI